MKRELFAARLFEAARRARDFARGYVEETLPDDLRFRVRLNSSYDGNALEGDEVVFPEDSGHDRAAELSDCSEQRVLDVLWRDHRVPEWINLSVIGESGSATFIEVVSCGRFTSDEARLYHVYEGRPPFHVLGPALPPAWKEGERFSLHRRSECWTWAELDRLEAHATKVWSLELCGHELDDRALAALPELPNLEILELRFTAIKGHGVGELRKQKLRVVRLYLDVPDSFSIPSSSPPVCWEHLDIENLPDREWGSANLFEAAPKLSSLTLTAKGALHLAGTFPGGLTTLTITAKRVVGTITPPPRLDSLSLHVREISEAVVHDWLERLARLRYLDLSGTPLSEAAVKRIASEHPELRIRWPKTKRAADAAP